MWTKKDIALLVKLLDQKLKEQTADFDRKLKNLAEVFDQKLDQKLEEQTKKFDLKLEEQSKRFDQKLDQKLDEQTKKIFDNVGDVINDALLPLIDEQAQRIKKLEKHTNHPPISASL